MKRLIASTVLVVLLLINSAHAEYVVGNIQDDGVRIIIVFDRAGWIENNEYHGLYNAIFDYKKSKDGIEFYEAVRHDNGFFIVRLPRREVHYYYSPSADCWYDEIMERAYLKGSLKYEILERIRVHSLLGYNEEKQKSGGKLHKN